MSSLRFSLGFLFRFTTLISFVSMSGMYLGLPGGSLALIGGGTYWLAIILLARAPYTSVYRLTMAAGILALTVAVTALTLLSALAVFQFAQPTRW